MQILVRRAERFLLSLPLRYRRMGDTEWKAGTIVNVSRSGVLFSAEAPLSPGLPIEMSFSLPPVEAGTAGAQVRGAGSVVRADPSLRPSHAAARFAVYRLSRGPGISR